MQQPPGYYSNRKAWFSTPKPRPDAVEEHERIEQMMVDHEYWAPRIGWTMVGLNALLAIGIIWFIVYWIMQGIQWVQNFF
jgi:hypothetical protein